MITTASAATVALWEEKRGSPRRTVMTTLCLFPAARCTENAANVSVCEIKRMFKLLCVGVALLVRFLIRCNPRPGREFNFGRDLLLIA